MSNQQVGIGINLTENASSIAPRVSQALGGVTSAAEKMKDALDIDELSQKYQRFIDNFDDLDKLEKAQKILEKERTAKQRERREEESRTRQPVSAVKTGTGAITNVIGQGTGIAANLGASGDAMGASGDILSMLGGAAKFIPGIGAVIAGGVAIGTGMLLKGGNSLVKQYEGVMEESMDLAAALGKLGKSAEENSKTISDSMTMASNAASEFGYSIREGIGVGTGLARHGVSSSGNLFAYARGFGVGPQELTQYYGLGRRFGQQGNILGLAAGGLEESGMSSGRFMEYLSATQQIFEDGISKGVFRGFEDISATQNMLAGMGEMWKGGLGAQRILQMSNAVAGATSLGKQTDYYLYRAASGLSGGDMLGTMETLEKGLTPELLGAVVSELDKSIGRDDRTGYVMQLREMFGLNYTMAGDIYESIQKGDYKKAAAKAKGAPGAESAEQNVLRLKEEIENNMRLVGKGLLDEKEWLMKRARDITEGLVPGDLRDLTVQATNVTVLHHKGPAPAALKDPALQYDLESDLAAWSAYRGNSRGALKDRQDARTNVLKIQEFLTTDAAVNLTNETLRGIDTDYSGKIDTKEEISALIQAINHLTIEMQKGVEVETDTPSSLGRGIPR